jgi:hypothetical protein
MIEALTGPLTGPLHSSIDMLRKIARRRDWPGDASGAFHQSEING